MTDILTEGMLRRGRRGLLGRLGWSSKDIRDYLADEGQNKQAGDPRFKEILDTLWEIHKRKAAEYGDDKDPLGNISEAAEWGVSPWANAMIHATDKIRSLKSYVKTGKEPEEGMADTFFDAANYIIIACLVWEKSHDNPSAT